MPAYTLPAGDAFTLRVPLLVDGAAAPVAGWSVWFALVQNANQTDAEAAAAGLPLLSLGNGISVYDATSWLVDLPGSATQDAKRLTYTYYIRARSPDGRAETLETGTLTITPGRPTAATA